MYTCLQDWYIVIHWHELASVLLTISNDNTIFYNTYTCFTRFIYSNTLTWEAGISSIKPGVCPFALDVVSYLCYSLTNTLCKQLWCNLGIVTAMVRCPCMYMRFNVDSTNIAVHHHKQCTVNCKLTYIHEQSRYITISFNKQYRLCN